MTVRVHNAGASAQNRYTYFMLPKWRSTELGEVIDCSGGATCTAYKHEILSNTAQLGPVRTPDGNAVMYAVASDWAAGATSLTLAAGTPVESEFALHAAYGTSQCGEITAWGNRHIPRVFKVTTTGGSLTSGVITETEISGTGSGSLRSQTPTFRIDGTHIKQAIWETHVGGWHIRHAMTFATDQAVAEFSTSFLWSDETYAADWKIPCEGIRLKYDYEVKLKFEDNEGFLYTDSDRTITLPSRFENGDGSSDRYSWVGNWWHGRRIAARGWMLGQVAGEVTADRELFDVCAHLNGVASASEWDGDEAGKLGFQFSGKVGPVPVNTGIRRPDYADTTRHFVSWDRGTTSDDDFNDWISGLQFARYYSANSEQGNLAMQDGSQVVHGYQELYDFEASVADYGLRPCWVTRDGNRYPPIPWAQPSNMTMDGMYPFNPGQFTRFNFGRSNSNTSWSIPNGGDNQDGMNSQHFVVGTLCAYYQLAKWDDYAYTLLIDIAATHAINQRRGDTYTGGSNGGGDREPGRCLNAALQMGKVCPELRGLMADLCLSPVGSFGVSYQGTMHYISNPPASSGGAVMSVSNITSWTDSFGQAWTLDYSPLWQAHGIVGIYQLYLMSGHTAYSDMAHRLMDGLHSYAVVNVLPDYVVPGIGVTAAPGLQLPFCIAVHNNGVHPSAAQRVSSHPDFARLVGSFPGTSDSIGNDDLRGWIYPIHVLARTVGRTPTTRTVATTCLQTILRSTTLTPRGWWQSNWDSWANLSQKLAECQANGFGWGD